MDSPPSETPRQSLLGSINFLARSSRPRAATTHSGAGADTSATASPNVPSSTPANARRRTAAATPGPTSTSGPPPSAMPNTSGLGYMLRRRRSANTFAEPPSQQRNPSADTASHPAAGPTHRIRLVPHLESNRSLHFEAITRDVRQGDSPLRIGRFTERSAHSGNNSNKLAFKSKVVSRGHAEIWFDSGTFFIKDTKSSSGTFLNHIRLSSPNTESRPHPVKDGDILQLGVDYQGGTEEIYRCVKMRVELGREWQSGVNAFNSSALTQLKTLSGTLPAKKDGTRTKSNITDCCICLFQVTVCQALFIAPCSHVYHYKCIRPLLEMHHPGFSCPLCRTFADLEADVEVEAPAETAAEDDRQEEDVEMALAEEPEQEQDQEQNRTPDHEQEDSTPLPGDMSHSPPVAIPRQPSAEGEGTFPGADSTPLNNTFLATLTQQPEGIAGERSSGGPQEPTPVSDEDADEEDSDAHEHLAGVGGKRKR